MAPKSHQLSESTHYRLGLVGMPLTGSKSPEIHQVALSMNGILGQYDLFETSDLTTQIKALMDKGYLGVNVTLPYKESVITLLDEIDQTAEAMGAVNTIRFEAGKSKGYNTDGFGFVTSLTLNGHRVSGQSVLVIGAGGASRGICYALLQSGVKRIWLTNRTEAKALALVETFQKRDQSLPIEAVPFDQIVDLSPDIVINTTSVGMSPLQEETVIDPSIFSSQTLVCDIVYKPHETIFLKKALAHGQSVVYGLDMLICQALLAEKIWFGEAIDLDKTLNVLRNRLLILNK